MILTDLIYIGVLYSVVLYNWAHMKIFFGWSVVSRWPSADRQRFAGVIDGPLKRHQAAATRAKSVTCQTTINQSTSDWPIIQSKIVLSMVKPWLKVRNTFGSFSISKDSISHMGHFSCISNRILLALILFCFTIDLCPAVNIYCGSFFVCLKWPSADRRNWR